MAVWSWPLSDPDAGMYADIGVRMAASGDWITPRFNGLRYQKPPLLYWLLASTYRLAGPSEWGAHLWPALAGISGVAMTLLIGREAFGASVGSLSGLVLATTIGYFVFARVVSTDLLFASFFSLALFAFLRGYRSHGRGWHLLLYVSIGLAGMTKGVIGFFLPGLVILAFLILTNDLAALKRLGLWWGMLLALAIALPWHLIVALLHADFFSFYVIDNHVLRFLGRRAFVEDDVPSVVSGLSARHGHVVRAMEPVAAGFTPSSRRTAAGTDAGGKSLLFLLLWGGLIIFFLPCRH